LFNLVYKDTKHKVIIQTIDQLFFDKLADLLWARFNIVSHDLFATAAILIVRRLRSAQKTTHRYCFAREVYLDYQLVMYAKQYRRSAPQMMM